MTTPQLFLNHSKIYDEDILFISEETGVGDEKALKMLFACDYDVCNAVIALNAIAGQLHPDSTRDFYCKTSGSSGTRDRESGLSFGSRGMLSQSSTRSRNSSECFSATTDENCQRRVVLGDGSTVPILDRKVVEVLKTAKIRRMSLQQDAYFDHSRVAVDSQHLKSPTHVSTNSSINNSSAGSNKNQYNAYRKRIDGNSRAKTTGRLPATRCEDNEIIPINVKRKRLSFQEECHVFFTESSSVVSSVVSSALASASKSENLLLKQRRSSLGKPVQRMEKLGVEDPERELYPEELDI